MRGSNCKRKTKLNNNNKKMIATASKPCSARPYLKTRKYNIYPKEKFLAGTCGIFILLK